MENQRKLRANLLEIAEPENINEALASPQAKYWKQAIKEELDSLQERKTWIITDLPENKRAIGCRWVFKLKTDSDGKPARFKARLVAQGFGQKKGKDYGETYSPVANFSVIRTITSPSCDTESKK